MSENENLPAVIEDVEEEDTSEDFGMVDENVDRAMLALFLREAFDNDTFKAADHLARLERSWLAALLRVTPKRQAHLIQEGLHVAANAFLTDE